MELRVTGPFVIAPAERAHIRVPLPGLLLEVHVEEWKRVEAGSVVARLDPTPFELEKAKAEAALARAKADLALLEAGARPEEIARSESKVAVARMKAEAAQKSLERNTDLHKRGMLSLELIEAAEQARNVAIRAQAQSESEVALLKAGSRKEESDGARVALKAASLPSETFAGEAGALALSIEEKGGIRVVRVRFRVDDPDGRLKPGMAGEARIDCGERRSLSIFGRKLVRLLRIEFW